MGFILANTGVIVLYVVIIIIIYASWWKLFEKAGKPGWMGIIPILNLVILLEIVGRPIWWIVMFLIPCVNIVFGILLCIDVAKSYGKDVAYAVGLLFLGFVFFPLLAFGDAKYVGPAAAK